MGRPRRPTGVDTMAIGFFETLRDETLRIEVGAAVAADLAAENIELSTPDLSGAVRRSIIIRRGERQGLSANVLRMDEEVRSPLRPDTRQRLLGALASVLPECGAVLVSDYAKGVVDQALVGEIAALARSAAGPRPAALILVDPKAQDFSRYAGCFAPFKP